MFCGVTSGAILFVYDHKKGARLIWVNFLDIWLVGLLILNVPVNNFSVMLGWSHRFLGITGYYQYFWKVNAPCSRTQHGLTRVGLEPPTLDPESEALTTRPPRSPLDILDQQFGEQPAYRRIDESVIRLYCYDLHVRT